MHVFGLRTQGCAIVQPSSHISQVKHFSQIAYAAWVNGGDLEISLFRILLVFDLLLHRVGFSFLGSEPVLCNGPWRAGISTGIQGHLVI